MRFTLLLAIALFAAPVYAKPKPPTLTRPGAETKLAPPPAPKPALRDHIDEVDYQHQQAAMWKDVAAQLELEAAQRRLMAAQIAAAESKATLDHLRAELNRQYQMTLADRVEDAPPHKIVRAK